MKHKSYLNIVQKAKCDIFVLYNAGKYGNIK